MSTTPTTSRPTPITKQPATPKPSPTRPGVTIIEDLDPPPYTVPTAVTPIEGADYGLGIRHFDQDVIVGPHIDFCFERWPEFRERDRYRMWVGGRMLVEDTIGPEDLTGERFFLSVPRSVLNLDPVTGLAFIPDVYGEVLRIGTDTPSTSPPQTIFIKITRPGGVDERPFEPWHSKLRLSLDHTIIGANQSVVATITQWEHMRVNDLVVVYWGGEIFDVLVVTPDQVGRDLTFEISAEFIALVGSGHYAVAFYLNDEVRNESGPAQPWSKPVSVEVNLDITLLDEPFLIEAGDEQLILDADALGRDPAHAEVEIRRGGPFLVGDIIELTVEGTTHDGVYVRETFSQTVGRVPEFLEFVLRNEMVRSLLLSQMSIFYVRRRTGVDDLPSRRLTVAVVGLHYELPRPNVREAHGPFIEPDLPRITVEMPDYQPPGTAGDNLEVVLQGFNVDFTPERISSSRLAGNPPRTRDFPTADYMRLEGLRDANVHYIVTGAEGIRESERRWVQVGRPPRTLPAPVIQEAVEGNIDPSTLGSNGTLEKRADFRPGDITVVRYTGSIGGVLQQEYRLFLAANPLVLDIPRQLILDNTDGTITVSYLRERGGVFDYSEELVVTVGTALGELFLPEVLEATTEPDELDPLRVWPAGATVRVRYFEIKRGDQVEVRFEGLPGEGSYYEVKTNQSGDFIDVTIPTDVIGYNIHPRGRDILVSFVVIRNGFPTVSPLLVVHLLSLHHLPGPLIDSIGENAVLEVPLLQDFEETRVPAWPYAKAEQRMWLLYQGTRNTGAAYENEVYRSRPLSAAEAVNGITSETPVLALRNLQDWSELTISFWVTFDHSGDINNAVLFEVRHHMIELQAATYPFPRIKDSVPPDEQEVSIDPVLVENKCQVLVSYDRMNQGGVDRVELHWFYPDGTLADIPIQEGLDGGTVTFNISNDILAKSVNSTIHLQYITQLGRGGIGISEEQTVMVQTIQPADLVRVLLNGVANGGTLNPPDLVNNAIATSPKWRLSLEGQRVWLSITTDAPGVEPLVLLTNHRLTAIQQANGLANIQVSRAWLLSVPNNARITVRMRVTFNGSENEVDAVEFPTTEYTVRLVSPLVFDSSFVQLGTRTYLIPGSPNVLPAFGAGNSIRRVATGGTAPYTYSSSNTGVAVVDASGLVTVRGNGSVTITVRDSSVPAQTRSYTVSVSGVVLCYGLGGGTKTDINNAAARIGVRVATIDELRALSAAYGNRWPMGNASYWSSTWAGNFFFFDYWYGRNINTGAEATFKQWVFSALLGVGLR